MAEQSFKNARFYLVALGASLLSGGVGMVLHLLLDLVEEAVFGRAEVVGQVLSDQIAPQRRVFSLLLAGLLSALVWYVLQKSGPLVGVKGQIAGKIEASRKPPFVKQLIHGLWQVISVGLGSPIGKEGAPRELAALLAGRLALWTRVSEAERQFLVLASACCGLAAVYQVPLASTFFAFEVLGLAWSLRNGLTVLAMTVVATIFARLVVPGQALYRLAALQSLQEVWWLALILGLVLTPLAMGFKSLVTRVQQRRVTDRKLLWTLPLAFALLAALSWYFPELLGNGSNLAQQAFNGMPLTYASWSFAVKALAVLLALWAGAYGGTLTPSFALGAVAGLITADLANVLGLAADLPSSMALGATVFLGVNLGAPLAALFMVVGFTGQSPAAILPLLLATAISQLVKHLILERKRVVF